MASSPFERQVIEAEGAEDPASRPSRVAEDGPQQYPPAPSFVAHDRPAVRLVELPAWLQAFAASVGEPSESESVVPDDKTPMDQSLTSSSDREEQETVPEPKSSKTGSRIGNSDFISEDDLPEWLRSIAPEDSAADASADVVAEDRSGEGDHVVVPNVARAWSTSKDARGADEATSLFALVASQTPQHALPDAGAGGATSHNQARARKDRTGRVEEYGATLPPGGEDADVQRSEAAELQGDGAVTSTRGLPMLPIIIVVILILVLAGTAAALFLI